MWSLYLGAVHKLCRLKIGVNTFSLKFTVNNFEFWCNRKFLDETLKQIATLNLERLLSARLWYLKFGVSSYTLTYFYAFISFRHFVRCRSVLQLLETILGKVCYRKSVNARDFSDIIIITNQWGPINTLIQVYKGRLIKICLMASIYQYHLPRSLLMH